MNDYWITAFINAHERTSLLLDAQESKMCGKCDRTMPLHRFELLASGNRAYICNNCKSLVKGYCKTSRKVRPATEPRNNKSWRAANLEWDKAYQKEYRVKQRAKLKEYAKFYYSVNREWILAKQKAVREQEKASRLLARTSPDYLVKKAEERAQRAAKQKEIRAQYVLKNKEKLLAYGRAWRQKQKGIQE